MDINEFYKRIDNEFFVGLVGPTRSGKSTFLRRFMELKVIPYISDLEKSKIIDDLPQSGKGKMIMTSEPKFIPNKPVLVNINNLEVLIRLVDSVGFVIPNSLGYFTEDGPRMVKTPWFDEEIPFKEAAFIGTKKVIENHSTIGVMLTSDGSFGDFKRSDYEAVESELINELKGLNKPFIILINSSTPNSKETINLKEELAKKYLVTVEIIDALNMNEFDLDNVFISSLNEFEIKELNILTPKWIDLFDDDFKYKKYFIEAIKESSVDVKKFKDIYNVLDNLKKYEYFKSVEFKEINPSNSSCKILIEEAPFIYDETIKELLNGIEKKEDYIKYLIENNKIRDKYLKYKEAIDDVENLGYGICLPSKDDLRLETPEIIKQTNKYGIKLKGVGEVIQLIKIDVDSTFEPIIGSIDQSKLMVDNMISDDEIWKLSMFGKNIKDLVIDGIKHKINMIPLKLKTDLKHTLERIINEQTGGVIAIIL